MNTLVRMLLAAVVALGLGAGAAPVASAQAAPSTAGWVQVDIIPDFADCKEAPKPAEPSANWLSLPPSTLSTGDPFDPGSGVTINSVYGTGYSVVTYDNGCKPGSGIMPGLGAGVLNLVGLEWPATLSSFGRELQSLLVEPDSWIGVLDKPITEATNAITSGFWRPWVTIALLLVAALVLTRAMSGALAGVVTAVVWALIVLVMSSWLINYPTEAVALVDDGVQTATVSIANGFSGTTSTESAAEAMDRQWDAIDRATTYRAWLEGTFGSSTSSTATTHGPAIFKSTHFTWSEWAIYEADPAGRGVELIEEKAKAFEAAADAVKAADPIAYDHLTGNRWMDRIGLAPLAWFVWLFSCAFLVVSSVGLLLAYLVVRVLVPFGPVAGVIFLLEPLRAAALGKLQKIAAILVMGPAYLLAALLVLRFNSAILGSDDIPRPLQILIVAVISFVAWWLIRPAAVAGIGSKVGRTLRRAAAVRLGTRGLRSDLAEEREARDEEKSSQELETTKAPRGRRSAPVSEPEPVSAAATTAPDDAHVPYYAASTSPGTFTDRPALEESSISHRRARELPAPRTVSEQEGDNDRGPLRHHLPAIGMSPTALDDESMTSSSPSGAEDLDGSSSSPTVASSTFNATDAERGSGGLDGHLMAPGEPMPTQVHEANHTFTEDGQQVFEIYRPAPADELMRSGNVAGHE